MLSSPCQPDLPNVTNFHSSGCISHNILLFRLREWEDLRERERKKSGAWFPPIPDFLPTHLWSWESHLAGCPIYSEVPSYQSTHCDRGCAGDPQYHAQVRWLVRRTYRTQPIVIFMAVIYYSERIQNNIRKEKRCLGEVWRKPNANFQQYTPSRSHGMHLIPPAKLWQHV